MANSFFKRLLKGVTASVIGGPVGAMALAIKKGIARRKERREAKSIDRLQAATAQLITGDAAYYHQQLKRRKTQQRNILAKIKEAQIMINRGATKQAAMTATGLTEAELNEPTHYYL